VVWKLLWGGVWLMVVGRWSLVVGQTEAALGIEVEILF
jgi:hypothetical protein